MKKASFEFIAVLGCQHSVSEPCSALRVTRQGCYAHRKSAASEHALRDAELAAKIFDVYEASRRIYGSPKAFQVLKRGGERVSRKRVARIMRENGWRGVTRRCAKSPEKEKRASKGESAPDLVKRDFGADGPNKARLAGIARVRTHQGRPCLAVAMDVWPRKVVGWPMAPRMTAELADDALKMAIARRGPERGCLHHSDHGSQYVSLLIGKTMGESGIVPSMGSVSSPWGNAVTESPMGAIKAECVHARTFSGREEAALEIFECIECFYNRTRIHSALGWLSPEGFEKKHMEEGRLNGVGQYCGHGESSESIRKVFMLCPENAMTGSSSYLLRLSSWMGRYPSRSFQSSLTSPTTRSGDGHRNTRRTVRTLFPAKESPSPTKITRY